jgi:hypothetical protein
VIVLNYDRQMVLSLFTLTSGGNLNPTAADITRFDQQLFDANDAILQEILPQMALPVDVLTRSVILVYKPQMPGNNARLQIRNACTYMLNTQNL